MIIERDTWDFVVIWTQIVSALGTAGAVWLSLWLALRRDPPKISIQVQVKGNIAANLNSIGAPFLVVSLTNSSGITQKVTDLDCKMGWFRRRTLRPLHGSDYVGVPLPVELDPGEVYDWELPLRPHPITWFTPIAAHLRTSAKWTASPRIFWYASLSTGQIAQGAMDRQTRQTLWGVVNRNDGWAADPGL